MRLLGGGGARPRIRSLWQATTTQQDVRGRRCRAYPRNVTPYSYARVTRLALWALTAIVITGVAVRLTGSGLGCPDWPLCEQDRIVAPLEYHALVEWINRLFTGVVAVAVIAAVLGSLRRRPRRSDLVWWSWGLVAGVLGQVILGALLVRTELDPRFVMGHFLLSMVLLWNAVVLDERARRNETPPARPALEPVSRLLLWAVFTFGAAALVAGTVVTGSGPHAGDTRAERLPFLVREVTRIHSIVALCFLGVVVLAWFRFRREHRATARGLERLASLLVLQAVVGYTQYFAGVPALLVGVHVALASVAWILVVRVVSTAGRSDQPAPAPDPGGASETHQQSVVVQPGAASPG